MEVGNSNHYTNEVNYGNTTPPPEKKHTQEHEPHKVNEKTENGKVMSIYYKYIKKFEDEKSKP